MSNDKNIKNLKKALRRMLKSNKTSMEVAERWQKEIDYAFYSGSIVSIENVLKYLNEIE